MEIRERGLQTICRRGIIPIEWEEKDWDVVVVVVVAVVVVAVVVAAAVAVVAVVAVVTVDMQNDGHRTNSLLLLLLPSKRTT